MPIPITDEQIKTTLTLVRTFELLAQALGVSVTRAAEISLRATQAACAASEEMEATPASPADIALMAAKMPTRAKH